MEGTSTLEHHSNEELLAITEELERQNQLMSQLNSKLRQSEKLLFGLIDNLPISISMKNKQGEFLLVNKQFERLSGIRSFELKGKKLSALIPHPYNEIIEKTDQEIFNIQNIEEKIEKEELLYLNYSVKTFKTTRFLLFDPVINDMVSCSLSLDITTSKANEAKLHERNEEYRVLIENAPDIITRMNRDLQITYVNPVIEKELDINPPECLSKSLGQIGLLPRDHAQCLSTLQEVLTQGKDKEIELRYLVEPGIIKSFNARFFPEYDPRGKITSILGIQRNITRYKLIEEELTRAKIKAEEADRLKSTFLSNMSHEIRTPMNAILGFSDLLSHDDLDPSQKIDYLSFIKSSGNQLLQLIEDIIDLAKIEAHQLKITPLECSPSSILAELQGIGDEIIRLQQKSNIDIVMKIPGNIPEIPLVTDPLRLKQVLTNLLSNAIKFTEKGHIEMGYESIKTGHFRFFVRDTGIGIPADMVDKIFERFRQVDDEYTRKHGGTGLGLTITQNLVRILGGAIYVQSEPGKGSTFSFTIPSKSMETKEKEFKPEKETNPWKMTFPGKKILIAEDEEFNYFYLHELLNPTLLDIHWAKDGREAIEILNNNRDIQLVLMDIKMPVLNGLEATRIIKETRSDVKVIAQTAYAMQEDRDTCLRAGCDEYLTKPILGEVLIPMIKKFLY